MPKWINTNEMDAALNYIATSNSMVVCSSSPVTYADVSTYLLASASLVSGDFTLANDTNGRKVTIGAKSGVSIINSGSANFVTLVITSSSTLTLITTCTTQYLTAGGTVDFPAWKLNIQNPT